MFCSLLRLSCRKNDIRACWPYCDLHGLNIFLFTSTPDALYESWLQFSRAHKTPCTHKGSCTNQVLYRILKTYHDILCISIFPYLIFDQGHHLNNLSSTRVPDATY